MEQEKLDLRDKWVVLPGQLYVDMMKLVYASKTDLPSRDVASIVLGLEQSRYYPEDLLRVYEEVKKASTPKDDEEPAIRLSREIKRKIERKAKK